MPPTADHATFRDLNIFEERLKDTAASLQHRKSRYQLFLAQLLVVITLLLVEVILPPQVSIISIPYSSFLRWLLPEIYNQDAIVLLHPYFTTGLLFVSVTTLVLFFASGMYSEKIAYANKYVPHTNRSLRSFNMYFNTRKPPLRYNVLWNPLSFFFPRPPPPSTPTSTSTTSPTSRSPSPSPSSTPTPRDRDRDSSPSSSSSSSSGSSSSSSSSSGGGNRTRSSSKPIPSIPPSTNPRGELIFSSRVDKNFREGYDRYRIAFEKKREEALRVVREQRRGERWWWVYRLRFWGSVTEGVGQGQSLGRTSSGGMMRGRGGTPRSGTPPTPTPTPASGSVKQRERSGSPMSRQTRSQGKKGNQNRRVTPDGSGNRRDVEDRDRDMRMRALERSLVHGGSG